MQRFILLRPALCALAVGAAAPWSWPGWASAEPLNNVASVRGPAAPTLIVPAAQAFSPSAPIVAPTSAEIAEGTEVRVELGERLSSATASVGDTFPIASVEEIRLSDGTVLPSGYSGKGEVTVAERTGMLGKSGQLGVRMIYLKVGDAHVHLRANKTSEGKSGVTNTVIMTVLFGPLGLIVHGHSIVYPKGQQLTAFVDQDTRIGLPPAPPPRGD